MGLIQDILGIGRTVGNVAEVFVPNKTKQNRQEFLRAIAANEQFAAEFKQQRTGFFDRLVDGLNRLPRPVMALGTVGLFVYAMVDPIGFTTRMQGLDYVPDPLWWLLGAVVSFYFGAREMHHFRKNTTLPQTPVAPIKLLEQPVSKRNLVPDDNAALTDWRNNRR
tara:strand:- start:3272 stop:3766 length:495 start_codon:yes stop_codon:yes gene_type:complete